MIVKGLLCTKCKSRIFSRARHDFRGCKCGNTFVDGGLDYFRGGSDDCEVIDIEVDATKKELYDDWYYRIDKYGIAS